LPFINADAAGRVHYKTARRGGSFYTIAAVPA
jgi:hypothetical protein